jgi:hypothetical protein
MQRLSGMLLMLAGAAFGAFGYLYLPPPQNDAEKLAEVTRISAAPDRDVRPVPGLDRTFSPATPLWPPSNQASAANAAVSPNANVAAKPNAAWTAVVTAEPSRTGKLTSSKPGDVETRTILTRDLQTELQRVGCYGGEINGAWTPSTMRAMAAFMDRVNATLPINEPDYILLTLVQGQKSIACGAACPSGQLQAQDGRCVPQAVMAQATRKTQRDEERRLAEVQKAQQQQRVADELRATEHQRRIADAKRADEPRVALERKRAQQRAAEAQRAVDAKRLASANKATQQKAQALAAAVSSATREELPWLKDSTQQPTTASTGTMRQPPPGMMAMGGPRSEQPQLPANAAAVTPDRGPRPELDTLAAANATADERPDAPDAADVVPPRPIPAVRPSVPESAAGAPGTKSGVTATQVLDSARANVAKPPKIRPAKITKRPSPRPPAYVVYKASKPRPNAYANYSPAKVRRGMPRPGSIRYMMYQAMGGVY